MIIGITGLGGSGKSNASNYILNKFDNSKVIHVDKLHVQVLTENPRIPIDIYGNEIFKDGKWNSDLFIEHPKKLAKTFEKSYELLVRKINDMLGELDTYQNVIIDFFALPKIKEIWNLCDIKILVKSSCEQKRVANILRRRVSEGKSPKVNMKKRDAFAPDYNLYKYNYIIDNNYDENYYHDLDVIINRIKEERKI